MNGLAYYDGVFGKRDEIRIPLSDRAIFFGDAVYEAAVGTERRIFLLAEHIERFYDNIKKLHIPFTLEANELEELLYRCVRKAGFSEYFLYFSSILCVNYFKSYFKSPLQFSIFDICSLLNCHVYTHSVLTFGTDFRPPANS